jgi:hypothetical protein
LHYFLAALENLVYKVAVIDNFRLNLDVIDIHLGVRLDLHHKLVGNNLADSSIHSSTLWLSSLVEGFVLMIEVLLVVILVATIIVSSLLIILVIVLMTVVTSLFVVLASLRVVVVTMRSSSLVVVVIIVSSVHMT